MKITAFKPSDYVKAGLGLKNIELNDLGRVVVLAGPNGAGKTRILEALKFLAAQDGARIQNRPKIVERVERYEKAVAESKAKAASETQLARNVEMLERSREHLNAIDAFVLDEEVDRLRVVDFLPRGLVLTDPASLTPGDLVAHAEKAGQRETQGLADAHEHVLAYVQNLQNQYWEVTHPGFTGEAAAKAEVLKSYDSLVRLIDELLSARLTRSPQSQAEIFGKPLAKSSLSDGQKIILQLAVALHAGNAADDVVLVMDEPETHLHAAALIQIVDKVLMSLPRAQLWIATHSVSLIAHLHANDPGSLHLVVEGSVSHAGPGHKAVFDSLLGDEAEQRKLLAFLELARNARN